MTTPIRRRSRLIEREVRALDKDQPISDADDGSVGGANLVEARFSSTLLTTFVAVALTLAAIASTV